MLAGGIDDVLITTELAGPIKARRLAALVSRWPDARVRVVVDSWEGASAIDVALPRRARDADRRECRAGPLRRRSGRRARRSPIASRTGRLRLVGLQGYEGNLQHVRDPAERQRLCDGSMERLAAAATDLRAAGHTVDVVTTGGTGTAEFCARHEAVTEVQPGSFIFMDADYLDTAGVPYQPALTVVATVISRPAAGSRRDRRRAQDALERFRPRASRRCPGLVIPARRRRARHAHPDRRPGTSRAWPSGTGSTLLPSHIDTTVNLHDALHAHRGGQIEATLAGRRARQGAIGRPSLVALGGDYVVVAANRFQVSGTPLSSTRPRSSNSMPEPYTRSVTVRDTSTSSGPARAEIRAAMLTATPAMSSPIISHSPVCTPARTVRPRPCARSRIAPAQVTARAGPSKVARNPSPIVLSSRPRKRSSSRRTSASCSAEHLSPAVISELGELAG